MAAKTSCRPPRDVRVKGHWRTVSAKKRRKKRSGPPRGAYYIAEDTTGRTCGHHHRTMSGARRCANAQQHKEMVYRSRYLTRKQAKSQRVRRWDVTAKKGSG